jgi:hypothetical protein
MLDSNTRKSYGNKLKSKNEERRFFKDRLKLKTNKMSKDTFRNDSDLLVVNDKK